jgi:HEAT repeat protein
MRWIQSPQFWLGALVILAGAGVLLAVVLRRNREEEPPRAKDVPVEEQAGFKDVVKNPERWKQDLDESDRALDQALRAAKTWDDKTIEAEVRRFLFDVRSSGDAWIEGRVLRGLGARVQPTLLACLGDVSLRGRLVTPTEEGVLPETPFRRLCELLEENPPPASVPLLTPFLDDPSAEIRKAAALVVGCVGSGTSVHVLRKALADPDEYVRSYAIIGLQRALKANRLDDLCRRDLFAPLLALITEGKNADHAAPLLLQLDERKATEFFLSDQFLSPRSAALHEVLRALNGKQISVPRDRLLALVEDLRARDTVHPGSYQLAEAFRALGRHRAREDRDVFERYLTHKDETVASGAAAGLLASHDLNGYQDRVWAALEKHGVGGLNEAQRHYYAVTIFNSEVNNGGLSQYFFNSSGNHWRDAIAGLEAMGSKERLAVLREAVAKFGKAGPSTNRDERMTQLSALTRADDELFSELDRRYYKCTEVIDVLTMRYVLKRPEAFR